ncbi:hypothetical protein E2562_014441 [Oryza meyeriana var. granulata]|uniref:Uncharacterized protein n=1 Tax=Oryza meyeriana var. granulata TaxID=110450 RepID=A0A6G1CQ30_9ORYZ|nr:hypothetical protein E2562_014441 [Oryza meyeriana var. granulata]
MEHAKENDALNSCQAFSRYKYKQQTPFLYQQTGLSSNQGTPQSSGNYHAPKNGTIMVPKNHLQQKDGLPMMQLVYDKDSGVDTGVGSNSPAEGNGSSQCLESYNDKGEWWFEMIRHSGEGAEWTEESVWSEASEAVKERVRTLKEAAAVMSRAKVVKEEEGVCRRNRHPDYDFFLSRQPRR